MKIARGMRLLIPIAILLRDTTRSFFVFLTHYFMRRGARGWPHDTPAQRSSPVALWA